MSLTLTREKQFAVLASILDVGGVGTKKEVLDNIDTKGYLFFDDKDLKIKHNRNELDWRNNLAFVRKGLVGNGCIDDPEWNQWAITDKGIEYLQDLCSMILMTSPTTFKKLTTISVKRATELTDEEGVEYQTRKSELQDDLNLANQVQQITTTRIKRYQAIVNKLKTIYQGRCQVDNCNFTFLKKDGTPYSEAHHLVPLSEGGTQEESNVVIICANHHRMLHYADVKVYNRRGNRQSIEINGVSHTITYK